MFQRNLSTTDIWGCLSFWCGGLTAWWDVWQHSWPLPLDERSDHTVTTYNVPRCCQMWGWGQKSLLSESHCFRISLDISLPMVVTSLFVSLKCLFYVLFSKYFHWAQNSRLLSFLTCLKYHSSDFCFSSLPLRRQWTIAVLNIILLFFLWLLLQSSLQFYSFHYVVFRGGLLFHMGVTRLLEYMNWYLPLFIFSHFHILLLIHFLLTLFSMSLSFFFKISFIYFRDRGREGEKRGRERVVCERNIDWLPLAYAPTRTRLATQAWALTGN